MAIDLTGQRFGSWTVLSKGDRVNRSRCWLCRCDCGTEREIPVSNLRSGKSTQCKSCSVRAARRSNPETTNQMITTGAIKRLPALSDSQLEQLLNAVVAERDGRVFS